MLCAPRKFVMLFPDSHSVRKCYISLIMVGTSETFHGALLPIMRGGIDRSHHCWWIGAILGYPWALATIQIHVYFQCCLMLIIWGTLSVQTSSCENRFLRILSSCSREFSIPCADYRFITAKLQDFFKLTVIISFHVGIISLTFPFWS